LHRARQSGADRQLVGLHEIKGIRSRGYEDQREAQRSLQTAAPGSFVVSLLKRWWTGTPQGAVSHKHLPYYLDEFTFRFNRRRSRSRSYGKLFFRLVKQAVSIR
jgi:hypothetical protein